MEFSRPENPGVSSLSLLQGIFPTLGSNADPLHYRRILKYLSYQGSPRKPKNTGVGSLSLLQGIFRPRNQAGVSCTAVDLLKYMHAKLL